MCVTGLDAAQRGAVEHAVLHGGGQYRTTYDHAITHLIGWGVFFFVFFWKLCVAWANALLYFLINSVASGWAKV